MPEDHAMSLEARLEAIVRATPSLTHVLGVARDLDLPDWMIVSGAVYQRVLNQQTGRDPDYGIKDYDLAYFDASDISYEAEDAVIRRAAAAFEPPLRELVEVRNQAGCTSGSSPSSARPTRRSARARKCWSASSARCSRSAYG